MADEQRNLEVVTRIADLWNAGDLEAMLRCYSDDVEMVTDPGWPEPPARGKDAFERSSRDWREAWEKIQVDPGRLEPVGANQVLAEGTWVTRAAATGISGEMSFAILYTLRDGLVVRQQWFMDPAEARRAAGL